MVVKLNEMEDDIVIGDFYKAMKPDKDWRKLSLFDTVSPTLSSILNSLTIFKKCFQTKIDLNI